MARSVSVSRRSFLQASGLALAAGALRAQDATTFSSDVRVVNVLATVRTKNGEIVADLTKDDFQLFEDSRPQVIRYFSRETNLPLILGLLVDTSGSQRGVIGEEQSASFRFLDKVLREDVDKTFLANFAGDTELLQDLTSSKAKLRHALDLLDPSSPGNFRRGMGGGRRGGRGGGGGFGGTTLYDAVYLGADEIMKTQQGRKAMVLLTDGVDHGSRVSLDTAIETAQRADTLVYSILFSGEEPGRGLFLRGDGKKVLQRISRETGGGFFEVSQKQSIDAIYKRIEEELRSQYSIGYNSDQPVSKGAAFRTIAIKLRRRELVVQARAGYYPA